MKKSRDYKTYRTCRFCSGKHIRLFLDLGKQPLAGGFLKNQDEIKREKQYHLQLYFCSDCFLVQTNLVINKQKLFEKYYYSSSSIKTLVAHFKEFAQFLKNNYSPAKKYFIVEIGANDGIFIKILKKSGYKVLGVDPAKNIVKPLIANGLPILNDYFTEKTAAKIVKKYGQADIIVSSNTLAHIEDMHDVLKGIDLLLKDKGSLIFENHYLGSLIEDTQYDMVYHEHQYYYSILTLVNLLKQHGMEIYDVQKNSMHAGTIRVFVKKNISNDKKTTSRVKKIIINERAQGFDKFKTFSNFGNRVSRNKTELRRLLLSLKQKNKTVVGYGASGRGTVLSNYCILSKQLLDYVVDDSPFKQGLYTPGMHLLIYPSDKLDQDKPDYALLFAWSFLDEIKKRNKQYLKNGGKFIVPLPKVKII